MKRLLLLAVLTAHPLAAAAQPPEPAPQTRDRVIVTPYASPTLLFAAPPMSADDLLSPEDEMAFTRAVLFVRAGRLEDAGAELERLGRAYPDSRRVASARALAWVRRGEPKRALALLDEAAARQRELAARRDPPGEPERFALERAEAYIALGESAKALPWMVEAVVRETEGSQAAYELVLQWATDEELGPRLAREAAKQSDADPGSAAAALLASEIDALRGAWPAAWARLDRAQAAGDGGSRGELQRALALRLSAHAGVPPEVSARAWLEVSRRAPEERARLEAFRLLLEPAAPPARPGGELRAAALPAADLAAAWQELPAAPEREALGLRLASHLRDRAEWAAADQVAGAVSQDHLPADLRGAALLERGLARVRAGDLEAGRGLIEEAAAQATGPDTRARALYALAEARYYGGDFPGAHEGFTQFTQLYPRERETNDALERLYLLEGDGTVVGPSASPGLAELATGHYAAVRGAWPEAERLAGQAAEHAAAGRTAKSAGDDDVRAHAALLRSQAVEAQARVEEAVLAALWVADSLSTHRLAPLARRRAADLLLAAGREADALSQYEEILVRHPNSWIAPEVRRRVMELRSGKLQ